MLIFLAFILTRSCVRLGGVCKGLDYARNSIRLSIMSRDSAYLRHLVLANEMRAHALPLPLSHPFMQGGAWLPILLAGEIASDSWLS